jgi:hypothetical protein
MNKFLQVLLAVFCLVLINSTLIMLFSFFDIKRELYNEYMNWFNMIVILVIVLPDTREQVINKLFDGKK